MHSNSTNHDKMNPAGAADAPDQAFLDEVFERAVRLVEDGLIPETDALLAGHEAMRAEVERLVHLARHVAVGAAAPLPTLAGFTLLQQLGQGGMGTVYLARQHSLGGRPVALKVLPSGAALSPRSRARFLAEASAIARLRHPNIVAVHDVVHQDDVYAYAMEWIDGSSLGEAIAIEGTRRGGQAPALSHEGTKGLGISDVCRIGLSIARALEAVHVAGLLHRDIKPSNILLHRDGTPLLADFGLARELDSSVHTQAGHFAGTVAYAPPEQLRGDSPSPPGRGQGEGGVDARSDIYALGVTLYHALALRLPFEGRNPATMLRRIEAGAATPLRKVSPRVPRDLETIVAKAMEADPARRYQTAGELATDLERFMNYQPIHARPAGLFTRGVKLVRRNRGAALGLTLGSAVTFAVAAALVTYYFFLPGWVAAHVRDARLTLLEPNQANGIASSLMWGASTRGWMLESRERREAFDRALAEYDAALRLSPYDASLQAERTVVRQVREGIDRGIPPGEPSELSLRNQGLYAFLIHDASAAIKHWSAWEKTRDSLTEPDPLVDAALGVLYLFDDQAARAYPRLQKAVEAFPGVGFLMEYLADAAAKCGDAERARRWLEESKRLPRRDGLGAAERVHAAVLAAKGRNDEAIAAYQELPDFGPPQLELARLLAKQGRSDAMPEYARLVRKFPRSVRVAREYRATADNWWTSLSSRERHGLIRAALDKPDESGSLVTMLRSYAGTLPNDDALLPPPTEVAFHSSLLFQISNLKFATLTALCDWLSSPSLESLSLNELAERMEVENMSLWSRIPSFPCMLKELQLAAWRWPALQYGSRLANSAFVAFAELRHRQQRLSRLAAMSAATVLLGAVASQPANGQCTTPPCFQGVGDLPGGTASSSAIGLSLDGTTVVGLSNSANGAEAFRWNTGVGIQGLGDFNGCGFSSIAYRCSADGSIVVGGGQSTESCCGGCNNRGLQDLEPFRWTQAIGLEALGDLPGGAFFGYATAVSDDGNLVVGWSDAENDATNDLRAFYWTPLSGMQPLPDAPGGTDDCEGIGINADGSIIVGIVNVPETSPASHTAGYWTNFTNPVSLGDLPGGIHGSLAYDCNSDASVIVGYGHSSNGQEAMYWTSATGMVGLGDLPGGSFGSAAVRISRDGRLIVGSASGPQGFEAVLWDESRTLHSVVDVLSSNGVNIPNGWILMDAGGVTINANIVTLCGSGRNPVGNTEAWIARYSVAPPCDAADVTQSPAAASTAFGGSAQLSVVATGTGPLSFQWRKNNVPLTDGPVGCGGSIAGATTDTLVLNTVTFVEGGNYDCVVTNACGNDTSAAAVLTINPPPAAADVNHDGQVNGADIQALVNALLAP